MSEPYSKTKSNIISRGDYIG